MKKITGILFKLVGLVVYSFSADYPTALHPVICYTPPYSDQEERVWTYYSRAVSIALEGSHTDTFSIKISYDVSDKNEDHLFDIEHKCLFFTCKDCAEDESGFMEVGSPFEALDNISGIYNSCDPENDSCRYTPDAHENFLLNNIKSCYYDTLYITAKIEVWQTHNNECEVPEAGVITRYKELTLYPADSVSGSVMIINSITDTVNVFIDDITIRLNYFFAGTTSRDIVEMPSVGCTTPGSVSVPTSQGVKQAVRCPGDSVRLCYRYTPYYRALDTLTTDNYLFYGQVNCQEPEDMSEDLYLDTLETDLCFTSSSICYMGIVDTLNDTTFQYNNQFTQYQYYSCLDTECGQEDSFMCSSYTVFVFKPLISIPYSLRPVCGINKTGCVEFNLAEKYGGYFCTAQGCQDFAYLLYKDEKYDSLYDDACEKLYMFDSLNNDQALDSVCGLVPGDYRIRIFPTLDTSAATMAEMEQCYGNGLEYFFTIHAYPYKISLGEDRILCEDTTVRLSVPESYTENGNTVNWEYCHCLLDTNAIEKHGHYIDISKGGGGYHFVRINMVDGCTLTDTVIVADLNPPVIQVYTLPSVINTSAVKYNSNWALQPNTISWKDAQALELFNTRNPYANGTAGMFRPEKDYDYLDVRSQTETTDTTGVNIRQDGSIPDYIFFNYSDPNFFRSAPQWTLNNTITAYNPSGYDVEGKDILNNFSAALYAYRDKLPVAKAVNAKYDEIGFESFEEYDIDAGSPMNFDSVDQLTNSTGNIDLVSHLSELTSVKNKDYEIVAAFNKYAMIDGNVCTACDKPFKAKVFSSSVPKTISEKIKILTTTSYNTTIAASPCGDSRYHILKFDDQVPGGDFNCNYWAGKAVIGKERYQPAAGPYDLELSTSISHTGKNSLKINANARIYIPQIDMELQPGKQYMLGAWIHTDAMDDKSPEQLRYEHARDSTGIMVRLPNNEKILMVPTGEVIEGWQRVEGAFTMPMGERTMIHFQFTPGEDLYLDDIRIYPFNGAIQTYVYDKLNYRLRATLDQNNYATIYQYDEAGNLFLLKKETEDGIKTIQVSGSYIKPNK